MKKCFVRFFCSVLAVAVLVSAGAGSVSAYADSGQVMVETRAGLEEVVDVTIEITPSDNGDGSTTVHTEVGATDDVTDSGMIMDYSGSEDVLVSPEGTQISSGGSSYSGVDLTGQYFVEGGSESETVVLPPELSVDIPLKDSDDPATEEPDNVSRAETERPAGTLVETSGSPKENEEDGKYDYTETTVVRPGSVTVSTNEVAVKVGPGSADSDMSYVYGTVDGTVENDMISVSDLDSPYDVSDMTVTEGFTHVFLGADTFSHFCAALVCTEGAEGEEPIFYKDGVPYYVQMADHSVFEKRKLYVDERYMDGECIDEKTYARWDYVQQFVLVDAATGELITTYCADQKTNTQDGYGYIMENVEDASYYSQTEAEMIRSVALNGYWNTESGFGSIEDVRSKLEASGQFTEDELAALTGGMAMTATQYAIWTFSNVSNGDKYINSYAVSQKLGVGRVPEDEKDEVELIFKYYNYLINLEPTKSEGSTADTLINENNFISNATLTVLDKLPSHPNNADGDFGNDAYLTDLSFALVVTPDPETDELTVEVVDKNGNHVASGRIAGEPKEGEQMLLADENGNYTLSDIVLVEGEQQFNITLQGVQNLDTGVYLYTSEIRDDISSQAMVGVASGERSVDVTMSISFELSVDDELLVKAHVWREDMTIPLYPDGGGGDGDEKDRAEPPKTADSSHLYIFSALISGLALVLLQLTGRREPQLAPASAGDVRSDEKERPVKSSFRRACGFVLRPEQLRAPPDLLLRKERWRPPDSVSEASKCSGASRKT